MIQTTFRGEPNLEATIRKDQQDDGDGDGGCDCSHCTRTGEADDASMASSDLN
jgi:hypothetical protein